MVLHEQTPGKTSTPVGDDAGERGPGHYTGVIIIHGIGNEKRNETLQEAVNAITDWYNHIVGLALRPEGAGRVWLRTELTDSDDPDAPSSRATIELEAPSAIAARYGAARTLRLSFREVWWAQAFGAPSAGSVTGWALRELREQLREQLAQLARLLLPAGFRLRPARTARRAPAREIAQALPYLPLTPPPTSDSSSGNDPAKLKRLRSAYSGLRRALWRETMHTFLRVNGLIQYVMMPIQWLLLAPLAYLLLVLLGIRNVLAIVLPILQVPVLTGVSALLDSLSLHWLAPLQAYVTDYTRSASMRSRFERELRVFIRDEGCDRIIVIAHSIGTVIAYEGLATSLADPATRGSQKPVTFICLGQALRRMWLLASADPHRLRSVLPEHVRWIHFWARFDPVAVEPLSPRSLPRLRVWPDPEQSDPYEAICATLARCENVGVVNTDSVLTDHTTYWQNREQVVGPIARELVAGHKALETVVDAHLATSDDVLRRRVLVAWHSMLAYTSGFVAYLLVLLLGFPYADRLGQITTSSLSSLLAQPIRTIAASGGGSCGSDCGPAGASQARNPVAILIQLTLALVRPLASSIGLVVTAVVALTVMGITVALIAKLISRPATFTSTFRALPSSRAAKRGAVALAVVSLVILGIEDFLAGGSANLPSSASALQWWPFVLGIGTAALACSLGLLDSIRSHRWGWFVGMLLLTLMVVVPYIAYTLGIASPSDIRAALVNRSPATIEAALFYGLWAAGPGAAVFYGLFAGPTPPRLRRKEP